MALMLAKHGKHVTIIDQGLTKNNDGRILALSFASHRLLDDINAWGYNLACTAINTVQISHNGLGVSQIVADKLNLPTLGYTVKYADICESLLQQVKNNSLINLVTAEVTSVQSNAVYSIIEYQLNGTINLLTCDLLIMAEGGKLLNNIITKKTDYKYNQQALVFHIKTQEPVANLAHERFGGIGPLVLLPYQNEYVVVWSLPDTLAIELKNNHEKLIQILNNQFTRRFGKVELASIVSSFPLQLIQVEKRTYHKMVVIGNSAQTVHPVSAQGLNLGLRDASMLCEQIVKAENIDNINFMKYELERKCDADAVITFTHYLATKMESNSYSVVNHARGAGIIALSNLPLVQNHLANSLIFGI